VGVREAALVAQNVDEDAIAAFAVETVDRGLEDIVVFLGRASLRGHLAAEGAIFHCERLATTHKLKT
jgi:hypothetical protein